MVQCMGTTPVEMQKHTCVGSANSQSIVDSSILQLAGLSAGKTYTFPSDVTVQKTPPRPCLFWKEVVSREIRGVWIIVVIAVEDKQTHRGFFLKDCIMQKMKMLDNI